MPRYSKKDTSNKSQEDALVITNGIKKPNQTKEQTKLINQGIAKGIELYKKQQKAKAREKDKDIKKHAKQTPDPSGQSTITSTKKPTAYAYLPWILLLSSWGAFIVYYSQNQ